MWCFYETISLNTGGPGSRCEELLFFFIFMRTFRDIVTAVVYCYITTKFQTWLWPFSIWRGYVSTVEFTKVCMGKNVNSNFSRNYDIFAIEMTYLNALLSFLLSSCFSARSVAIWASYRFSCFLRRGNTKSDNSLKRLRIALKSKKTTERTTRHWGMSFLLQKYHNFG